LVHKGLQKYTVYRKPVIAAVNGDCIAGGIELMLASDIRLAAPSARFGLTEVKFGVYPFGGATTKLQAQIGYVHAMELLMTGKLIDAEEAARINLINRVVPREKLLDECLAIADTIAGNSPAAVQAVKEQYSTSAYLRDIGKEPLEQTLGDRVRQSPDFKEGVASFLEKRKPNY
jgi:enoyl-CoA hydratase